MDKYEKGEKLGQGQFGVVFKARHKEVHFHHIADHHRSCLCISLLQCACNVLSHSLFTPTDGTDSGHQKDPSW